MLVTRPGGGLLQAHVKGKLGRPMSAEYSLDELGVKRSLFLPSIMKTFRSVGRSHRLRSIENANVPDDLKEKVASLLAQEFSKQVRSPFSFSPFFNVKFNHH